MLHRCKKKTLNQFKWHRWQQKGWTGWSKKEFFRLPENEFQKFRKLRNF